MSEPEIDYEQTLRRIAQSHGMSEKDVEVRVAALQKEVTAEGKQAVLRSAAQQGTGVKYATK